MTQEMLIPATVIGSWSFPGWFEKFVADVKADPELFGPTDRDEAVGDAVRLAIDDQIRAGLDRITDGEMQRVDFNLGFYEYLRGLEPLPRTRRWAPPRTISATVIGRSNPSQHPTVSARLPNIAASGNSPTRRSRCQCPVPSLLLAASMAGQSTPIVLP